jgi:hypothetical protein
MRIFCIRRDILECASIGGISIHWKPGRVPSRTSSGGRNFCAIQAALDFGTKRISGAAA